MAYEKSPAAFAAGDFLKRIDILLVLFSLQFFLPLKNQSVFIMKNLLYLLLFFSLLLSCDSFKDTEIPEKEQEKQAVQAKQGANKAESGDEE